MSEVHKFLRQFALRDDRVASGGFTSDIVPARISHLNVEVYKAASAPAEIVFCEIETSSIAYDTLLLLIFYLVYFIVLTKVNCNGVVKIFGFNRKCDCSREPIRCILRYVVLK